jgi:hypothetical protein
MREIETADNGSESRVGADVGEEFGEYPGVRDCDLRVESRECGGVDGARGEKEGHKVDVPSCEAIRRNICCQLIDDRTYTDMSVNYILRLRSDEF